MIDLLTSPVAVFPNRLNPRMTSQLSMMLIFGGKKFPEADSDAYPEGLDLLPRFDGRLHDLRVASEKVENPNEKYVKVFEIPGGSVKRKIIEGLRRIGIHEASLFPELDHIGNYIRKEWAVSGPKSEGATV